MKILGKLFLFMIIVSTEFTALYVLGQGLSYLLNKFFSNSTGLPELLFIFLACFVVLGIIIFGLLFIAVSFYIVFKLIDWITRP